MFMARATARSKKCRRPLHKLTLCVCLFGKQVLRFYCVWDDRQALYGDRRPYRLHYFLEDDTVEILELHENNDGRDPFPVFLRRGPLPKVGQLFAPNYPTTQTPNATLKAA